jgi:hypothetical protein
MTLCAWFLSKLAEFVAKSGNAGKSEVKVIFLMWSSRTVSTKILNLRRSESEGDSAVTKDGKCAQPMRDKDGP